MSKQQSDPRCEAAIDALIAALRSDVPVAPPDREHLRNCAACSLVLERVRILEGELERTKAAPLSAEDLPPDPITTEVEMRGRKRSRRRIAIAFGVGLALMALLIAVIAIVEDLAATEIAFVALVLGVFGVLPLALVVGARHVLQRNGDEPPLYKRLRPGRQLSGVCLGLAERLRIPVLVLRIIFLGLLFFDGAGLLLYILLDLILPMHPDDRQYLLRYRLRRWWAGLRNEREAIQEP